MLNVSLEVTRVVKHFLTNITKESFELRAFIVAFHVIRQRAFAGKLFVAYRALNLSYTVRALMVLLVQF